MTVKKLDVGEVKCVAGRRERFIWAVKLVDGNGARCGLGANDKVRFKVSDTPDGSPVIDIVSGAAGASTVVITSLGSSTSDATGVVTLARADTLTLNGEKHFELDTIDAAASNAIAQPIRGRMTFLPSMGGEVGA